MIATLAALIWTQSAFQSVTIGSDAFTPTLPAWGNPAEWQELDTALKSAKGVAPSVTWKLNVFVAGALEAPSGLGLRRRLDLNNIDEKNLRSELALFSEMVRAYSKGRMAITFNYDLDLDPQSVSQPFQEVDSAARLPFPNPAGDASPRSLLVIHSAIGNQYRTDLVHGIPVSQIYLYPSLETSRRGHFAKQLLSVFADQMGETLTANGWFGPRHLTSGSRWDTAEFGGNIVGRYFTPESLGALSGKTPRPTSASSGAEEGVTSYPNIDPTTLGIDASRGTHGDYTILPPDTMTYKDGDVVGMWGGDVIVKGPVTPLATVDSDASKAPEGLALAFDQGQAEKLPAVGNWKATSATDNQRGVVGVFNENGFARYGRMDLLRPNVNVDEYPFLSVWVKGSASVLPIQLRVQAETSGHAFLFDNKSMAGSEPYSSVQISAAESFQKVVIDLRKLGVKGKMSLISVETPAAALYFRDQEANEFSLDDLTLEKTAESATPVDVVPAQKPDSRSPSVLMRKKFADEIGDHPAPEDVAELRGLVSDPFEDVRVSAIRQLSRLKVLDAENELIEASKQYNRSTSIEAMRALFDLGTPTALSYIRSCVLGGPFDHQRRIAGELTLKMTPPPTPASLIPLLVTRSWHAQMIGGVGSAHLGGEISQQVAFSFINTPEPRVRAAVCQALDLSVGISASRLKEVVISDPNPWVQTIAMGRLLDAETKEKAWATETFRTWSPFLTAVTLDNLPNTPAARVILKSSLSSPEWLVREAALLALAARKDADAADLETALQDKDPRVVQVARELQGK